MNNTNYNSIKNKKGVKIIDVQDSYSFKVNHLKGIKVIVFLTPLSINLSHASFLIPK